MRTLYVTESPAGSYQARHGKKIFATFAAPSFIRREVAAPSLLVSIYRGLKQYTQKGLPFRNGDKLVLLSDPRISWTVRERELHLNPCNPGDFLSVCNYTVTEARECAQKLLTREASELFLNWNLAADVISTLGFDEDGLYTNTEDGLALRWLDYVFDGRSRGQRMEVNRMVRFIAKHNHQRA